MVHRARVERPARHRAGARSARGPESGPRPRLPEQPRRRLVHRARRGGPRSDRRRGAVCRHGSFRQSPGAPRLVRPGGPGAGAQLLRAGRAADGEAGGGAKPLFPAVSRLGPVPDGGARHGGYGDRLAGGHFGRLFAHQAGSATRLPAAHDHRPHLGARDRPGVYPGHQLGAVRRGAGRSHRLRLLVTARRRLRRRRDGDDARRHAAHLLRDPLRLALSAASVPLRYRLLRDHRPDLLFRHAAEDRRRRLVPAGHRIGNLHADDHVAARTPDPVRAAARRVRAARSLPEVAVSRAAAARAGDGGLPDRHP